MPVPSQSSRKSVSLITDLCGQIRNYSISTRQRFQASGGNADAVMSFQSFCRSTRDQLATLIAVPGIDASATAVLDGYTGSITTDTEAVRTAEQNCVDWVNANVPKDGNGYLLIYQNDAQGNRTVRNFSPANLGPLINYMTALEATIS